MTATQSITGTVTDADGNPIEDAEITVFYADTDTVEASGTTTATGDHTLSVAAATYDVRARKGGYQPRETTDVPVNGGQVVTVDFTLPRRAHKVRGNLDDEYGIGESASTPADD